METHPNSQDAAEEGEMEATSAERHISRACMGPGMNVEDNPNDEELVNSDTFLHLTGTNIWEDFCMHPKGVTWPETWGHVNEPDRDSLEWDHVWEKAKDAWSGSNAIDNQERYHKLKHALSCTAGAPTPILFDKDSPIVDCLAKWHGNENHNIHEAWRKINGQAGKPSRWLDVDHGTCQPEEAQHRKKRKKRKTKGMSPFSIDTGTELLENGAGTLKGDQNRPRHKIWFSRNRRPEKNLSLKKITFSQEKIPNLPSINLMGLGSFNAGSNKAKHSKLGDGRKKSQMDKLDALFDDLVA
ncbi:hypothetical protein L1987_32483 [Smallanthus sonchifolius]|uniref:Uncharacterized protein n=1 Tax=Smallanthus sonchifolius TaxID=185202 RepID=A0ACB9HMQ3_9ASTR|nr:hypothetical protein L1987_32483 [Smallanthus sonchifolius]